MASVLLEDESLRDGLQAEKKILPLEAKISLFRLLVDAGVKRLQVGSFVHPKVVPQMSDTDELIRTIRNENPGLTVRAFFFRHYLTSSRVKFQNSRASTPIADLSLGDVLRWLRGSFARRRNCVLLQLPRSILP